jgi:hypothetical protein
MMVRPGRFVRCTGMAGAFAGMTGCRLDYRSCEAKAGVTGAML